MTNRLRRAVASLSRFGSRPTDSGAARGSATGCAAMTNAAAQIVSTIAILIRYDSASKRSPSAMPLIEDGVQRSTHMRVIGLFILMAVVLSAAGAPRLFNTVVNLESTSEDSANVSMGDLDGDGDLDLVLAKGRHTPLLDRVLLNNGKGAFVASDLGPTADRTYTAALADLDGDGDLDVLTSNDTPDKKLVYINDGKGRFTVTGTWGVPEWSTRNAAVADLNGDGEIDVIAANRPGPSFVCLNEGGRFTRSCIPIPAESATSIVPADFDKDGFVDLAVPSRDGGQSRIYFNDGKAGFARTLAFGPADAAARAAVAADFNGDGAIDLAVGDEKAQSLTVYINDGRGRFTPGFRVADKTDRK